MKKLVLIYFILLGTTLLSCGKVAEAVADCITESIVTHVSHFESDSNPKIVTFTISYYGEKTLDNSLLWDFGDGNTQLISGKTLTHTYAQPGTYTVIAHAKLDGGKCAYEVKKTVKVQ